VAMLTVETTNYVAGPKFLEETVHTEYYHGILKQFITLLVT